MDNLQQAYTEDGYIRDQEFFKDLTYRTIPANRNSCGCVAVYNLRHFCGQEAVFEDVLQEMDNMHCFHKPGPTINRVMREYLEKYLPGWKEVTGKKKCCRLASSSTMGIFRYDEEKIPHFVSYYRLENGSFRFFNVNIGLEDYCTSIEDFVEKHCITGKVRLFYWNPAQNFTAAGKSC